VTPAELDLNHHEATLNGVRLHWVSKGTGPLIVLLHGFPENWWSWRYQLGALAEAGFHAVAPDLRGYNQSEQRGPYDIDTLAADVRGLIAHLGAGPAGVVGHDWGGGLAWHFAAIYPDSCAAVSVLNAPHPAPFQKKLRSDLRQIWRSWYMFFFLLPWLPERFCLANDAAWLRRFYETSDARRFSREELAPIFEAIARPGAIGAAIEYYRVAVKRGLCSAGSFQHYPPIAAPALLAWGLKDRWLDFDTLVPGTERWVPNLTIAKLDDAHHFIQVERAEAVNALLVDFFAPLKTGTHAENNRGTTVRGT
jgi:pimeloyl-ACP methyl ester carboxylesterase